MNERTGLSVISIHPQHPSTEISSLMKERAVASVGHQKQAAQYKTGQVISEWRVVKAGSRGVYTWKVRDNNTTQHYINNHITD